MNRDRRESHEQVLATPAEGCGETHGARVDHAQAQIWRVAASATRASFLRAQGLTHVDFIKVDIAGGEIEMLKHSTGGLPRIRPALIVEPHYVGGAMSTAACCKLLDEAGYAVPIRQQVGESEPLIEARPK